MAVALTMDEQHCFNLVEGKRSNQTIAEALEGSSYTRDFYMGVRKKLGLSCGGRPPGVPAKTGPRGAKQLPVASDEEAFSFQERDKLTVADAELLTRKTSRPESRPHGFGRDSLKEGHSQPDVQHCIDDVLVEVLRCVRALPEEERGRVLEAARAMLCPPPPSYWRGFGDEHLGRTRQVNGC